MSYSKDTDKNVTLSVRNLWQLEDLEPILKEVVGYGFDAAPCAKLWISSIGRTAKEDEGRSGIHAAGPPWRAVDAGWARMTQDEVNTTCAKVNAKYTYDPQRPHLVVAYGAPHGTGLHIHYQVHPRTVIKLGSNG